MPTMQQIKYFAYGSNMCSGRLCARISCRFVATARLVGHQLLFHGDAFGAGAGGGIGRQGIIVVTCTPST